MRAKVAGMSVFSAALIALSLPMQAQEIVHALTGTVSDIDARRGTITVMQDNHTISNFDRAKAPPSFDKRIAAETISAADFDKAGAYSIVFYFGGADNGQVVALKSLGNGPFESTEGTVEKYDRAKSLEVRDSSGTVHKFAIDDGMVAETNFGVMQSHKFSANKGDRVRVVSSTAGGTATALFVRDL